MLIYKSKLNNFLLDVLSNEIELILLKEYNLMTGGIVSEAEQRSWKNSMQYMSLVLSNSGLPNDAGVAIEFKIPQTSKRIDFVISGLSEDKSESVVLIELKQWDAAEITDKDGIVRTRFKGGMAETSHPSYQVWSYASLINNFNENVYNSNISLFPCAYLHNYEKDGKIDNEFYSEYIDKAPLFLKSDALKLRDFIGKYIKHGDSKDILFQIDSGKIKPSKALADSLSSMISGNKEFLMIDDQKIVYENVKNIVKNSSKNKNVIIVEGGPGTGKTVVAINLLVDVIAEGFTCKYVTKNAAPRAVYESKLTKTMKKTQISNLFSGSGSFIDSEDSDFDLLVVDEAHRLNAKSGMFKNLGENQIKELIKASKTVVFFIDEDQRVTLSDIGDKHEIYKWAEFYEANVIDYKLSSQFRCNGSDGYLAWLDNVLQISETANYSIHDIDYEFEVFDSAAVMRDKIFDKNIINNKARLVAGYCWKWISKNKKAEFDIEIDDFKMKWNLASDGSLWIISASSVNEVGCIHTCQGLELDYVGVIIGPDLIVRDGKIITDYSKRDLQDSSLRGIKKLIKVDKKKALELADRIIKNTYRTLMTRGMKGCYVFSDDKETRDYFNSRIKI